MRRLTSTHWFRVGLASVSAAGILTALFALAGHSEISVTLQSALVRSEEHTSELQSRLHLVCRLLLEKKQHIIHLHSPHPAQDYHPPPHHQLHAIGRHHKRLCAPPLPADAYTVYLPHQLTTLQPL